MQKVDFENGSIAKNIVQTSLPLLVAQVISLLYSIVDRIYIGRIDGYGTQALGAIGLCFPIVILIGGFTNMFGLGGAPLFSLCQRNHQPRFIAFHHAMYQFPGFRGLQQCTDANRRNALCICYDNHFFRKADTRHTYHGYYRRSVTGHFL